MYDIPSTMFKQNLDASVCPAEKKQDTSDASYIIYPVMKYLGEI
jgi:hypothetical protein